MAQPDRHARKAVHGDDYVERFSMPRQERRLAGLIDYADLSRQAEVLDLGCGTGMLARLLSHRIQSYTGVDFSEPMVAAAEKMAGMEGLENCRFVCGDAVEFMGGNAHSFDAIFALDISEHVPDGEWSDIVRQARHSLRAGGKVYLHTPNLDFFIEQMKDVGLMRQFPEHIAVRSARDNMQFFVDARYSLVECKALPHYNWLRRLHCLSSLPWIGKWFAARLWIVATK